MAASPSVSALPWYDRHDYPVLLKLFSDPDKLPTTYDAWLKRAERTESQCRRQALASPGSGSVPFPLRPGVRSRTFPPIKRRA